MKLKMCFTKMVYKKCLQAQIENYIKNGYKSNEMHSNEFAIKKSMSTF